MATPKDVLMDQVKENFATTVRMDSFVRDMVLNLKSKMLVNDKIKIGSLSDLVGLMDRFVEDEKQYTAFLDYVKNAYVNIVPKNVRE